MALSRRYQPSWPSAESGFIGMDFSDVVPPGVALLSATLSITTNTSPSLPQTDFIQQPAVTEARQAWCTITGGATGVDYQCRWTVLDSTQHTWIRTALLLCAETS